MWQAGDTVDDTFSCEVHDETVHSRKHVNVDVKGRQKLYEGSKVIPSCTHIKDTGRLSYLLDGAYFTYIYSRLGMIDIINFTGEDVEDATILVEWWFPGRV